MQLNFLKDLIVSFVLHLTLLKPWRPLWIHSNPFFPLDRFYKIQSVSIGPINPSKRCLRTYSSVIDSCKFFKKRR